jgi:secretion/DNA translocation related CpaE-like protein
MGGDGVDGVGRGERRGLVICSDDELLDGLLRLAAAAGCEIQRAADAAQARRFWGQAPLVVLDVAAARQCAAGRLPRRGGVLIAVRGEPDPAVWRLAVAVGADHVVSLPQAEPWLVDVFADAAEGSRSGGAVLAVVGGRGGAGASVLAAAVAVAAVREGEQVLLVDCDPLGGGLDLVLGAEDLGGLRWPGLAIGGGRIGASALRAALPAPAVPGAGGLRMLSCGRVRHEPSAASVASVVAAGRRAGEIVVCDLPRHPTEAAATALAGADLTVLVVPADVRSAAAGAQVAALLTDHTSSVRLVVRGPAPGGIEPEEVAKAVGLPLLTAMRADPEIARSLERGSAPGRPGSPLAAAADEVLAALRGPSTVARSAS